MGSSTPRPFGKYAGYLVNLIAFCWGFDSIGQFMLLVPIFFAALGLIIVLPIAIHDLWMPALQHFASFWCANRGYEPVPISDLEIADHQPVLEDPPPGCSAFYQREIHPFVDGSTLLLRKTKTEDDRPWDFFADYTA